MIKLLTLLCLFKSHFKLITKHYYCYQDYVDMYRGQLQQHISLWIDHYRGIII